MNTKGIIFDLDGVIVFTDKFHYLAWKAVSDELGIYFDEKINNRLRGVSRMDSLDIILEGGKRKYSENEKIEIAEKKNEIYKGYLSQMTPSDVSDEVRKTLIELKRRGYLLAIGSSSKNTKYILERVALSNFFDAISDGTNIKKSKPDPEVFLKAAEFINLPACECAVVEDAFAGIDAAKSADMTAVAIGDATSYKKADIVLGSFSGLLKYFH
ncbi:MAG: beta-phosphoglucomutase [Eubacteriales bacterium]